MNNPTDEEVVAEWEGIHDSMRERVERDVKLIQEKGGGGIRMTGMWATGDYPRRWIAIFRHLAPEFEWTYAHPEHPLGITFTASPR